MHEPPRDRLPEESPATGASPATPEQEGLLETAVSVLLEPVSTLRRVTQQRRVWWAVAVTVVLTAAAGVVQAATLSPSDLALEISPDLEDISGAFRIAAIVGAAIFLPMLALVFVAIVTGIYQVMSMILGGKGPYAGLFAGLAFAGVPSAFGIPALLLPTLLGVFGTVLSFLMQFGLGIWVMVLMVIAIRENNGFSTGRATAAFVIPLVAFGVLSVVLVVLVLVLAFAAIVTAIE